MKRVCIVFLAIVLLGISTFFSTHLIYVNAAEIVAFYDDEKTESLYANVISCAESDIESEITFEARFISHNGQDAFNLVQVFSYAVVNNDAAIGPASSGGSGEHDYYYNTEVCPDEANYSKYNLLDIVQKGDIIYEANGLHGLTGHIAIVTGIITDASGQRYIRIVEALPDYGVVRSILDDTRVDEQGVTILRVAGATTVIKNRVVNFCTNQIGKSYYLDFAKDSSSSETDWYCSELVWAAYYKEGLDIEVSGNGEPGVTPRDILNSSLTTPVPYSS